MPLLRETGFRSKWLYEGAMLAGWKCHPSIHESFNALFFFRHWNEAAIIPFMIRGTSIIIFVSSSFSGGFLRQLFLIASSTRAREKIEKFRNFSRFSFQIARKNGGYPLQENHE